MRYPDLALSNDSKRTLLPSAPPPAYETHTGNESKENEFEITRQEMNKAYALLIIKINEKCYAAALQSVRASANPDSSTGRVRELRDGLAQLRQAHDQLILMAEKLLGAVVVEVLVKDAANSSSIFPLQYQSEIASLAAPLQQELRSKQADFTKQQKTHKKVATHGAMISLFVGLGSAALPGVVLFVGAAGVLGTIIMGCISAGLVLGIPLLFGLSYLAAKAYAACSRTYSEHKTESAKHSQISGWMKDQTDCSRIRLFQAEKQYQDERLEPLKSLCALSS